MNLYPIAGALKRSLPNFLYQAISRPANAILGPLSFSLTTGHLRSAIKGEACNSKGQPMPWYSWPAARLLDEADLYGKCVLEFGGGASTKFFNRKFADTCVVEGDSEWRRLLSGYGNMVFKSIDEVDPEGSFDIIAIDAGDRLSAAYKAHDLIAIGGIIILDNSDFKENTPAVEWLQANGYSRADFWGYPLGGSVIHCTSIFWMSDTWLWSSRNTPKQRTWV
jgi:hypothetical protein